jgi:glycosyltransferase involved in cell wall biosynthesis
VTVASGRFFVEVKNPAKNSRFFKADMIGTLVPELMPAPLISVMMPAYNAERHIGPAIESVLSQSCPDWELVIINDGSTDGTARVIAGYNDPRIRVFHQPNSGEAAARNRALTELRGEYVAFLDADDQYLPDHLALTVRYLIERPELDGVYTDGYYIDEAGNRLATLASHRRGPFEGHIFEQVLRASDVFGPPICLLLRRQTIVDKHLDFDHEIVIGPDWDFEVRYTETANFGYLNQKTLHYRVHSTNVTVATRSQKRKLSLARCREKGIKLPGFRTCSLETRSYAFYDLLVNLLVDFPERQAVIVQWVEFIELPASERARLFRLMAGRGVIQGADSKYVDEWFRQARALGPSDSRNQWLFNIYSFSPALCQLLLRLRAIAQRKTQAYTPFGAID